MTSMTQRYGDERTKAEALKQMLADVMMDSPGNGEGGGYVARLKRSVLSESSWAAVDYDSRHHHAYCEVSKAQHHHYKLQTTIYYLLLHTHMFRFVMCCCCCYCRF